MDSRHRLSMVWISLRMNPWSMAFQSSIRASVGVCMVWGGFRRCETHHCSMSHRGSIGSSPVIELASQWRCWFHPHNAMTTLAVWARGFILHQDEILHHSTCERFYNCLEDFISIYHRFQSAPVNDLQILTAFQRNPHGLPKLLPPCQSYPMMLHSA